jgi:hypothetical protein
MWSSNVTLRLVASCLVTWAIISLQFLLWFILRQRKSVRETYENISWDPRDSQNTGLVRDYYFGSSLLA